MDPAIVQPSSTKRHAISSQERQQLRAYAFANPTLRQHDLKLWFHQQFGREINQSIVSRALKNKYSLLDTTDFKRGQAGPSRLKKAANPQLEALLYSVHQIWEQKGIPINGDMIKQAASQLWQSLPQFNILQEPQWSNGWLAGFQDRHKIKQRKMSGEANSVPEDIEAQVQLVRDKIALYPLARDVYNMDETGLFWKATPDYSLTTERIAGRKKDKARISAIIACNQDGSDKLPLWLIGKSTNPRVFGPHNRNISVYPVVYKANAKAWMTGPICLEWLAAFARHTYQPGRRVLLLWDNHSAHEIATKALQQGSIHYNHVEIMFLPPNSTSRYQPLDQGIISALKVHYKKSLCQNIVSKTLSDEPIFITLLMAVQWIVTAWSQVSKQTISNCWRHSTLLGQPFGPLIQPPEYNQAQEIVQQMEQLGIIKQAMAISTFLNPIDEEIEDPKELDPIEYIIQQNQFDTTLEEDEPIMEPQPPTLLDAQSYINQLKILLPYLNGDCTEIALALGNLEGLLLQRKLESRKQRNITDWFQQI